MDSEIELKGVVVVVGNYGSGKTEVSINLAINQHRNGFRVRVADLDLVNPYFRTREVRKLLSECGIDVILPPEAYLQADLPILVPQVAGLIRQPGDLVILDAGGDDVGATVLAALADAFKPQEQALSVLQVVNPFRPNTETVTGCLAMRQAIEKASDLKVSAWVGNANLIDETNPEHIGRGYDFMVSLAQESGLPLAFITVPHELAGEIDMAGYHCPVLTIHRQLVPPWKKPFTLPLGISKLHKE
jgi:hypothetical protein